SPEGAEASLDALDHHVPDHLAADARRRGHPGDGLTIVAVEREGQADDLAVPAGELQLVRAPAHIRAQRRHLAIMLARPSSSRMAGPEPEQLSRQPRYAL